VLQIDAGIMNGMDFSPDSRQFVLGQSDGLITVYDLVTGKPPRQLPVGLPGAQLVVSSQQQFAISCNSTVEIRDINTGEVTATLPHPAPVNNLGWHPNGKMLAVACDNLKVYGWDLIAAKQVFVLEGFRNYGNAPAFSHTGDLLATTGWEGKTRLWDTQTGRQLFSTTGVGSIIPRFSADDRFLSASIRDDKLRIWEIAECAEYRTLVHTSADSQDPYYNPTVFGDGRLLAVGVLGGIGVWDLSSGRELHFLDLPGIGFTASEHSGTLLTNGVAGLLRWEVKRDSSSSSVFHVAPPQKLAVPGSVFDIACSRNGGVIASAQSTGALVVHRDRPDQPVQLTPHADVRYVSVSADGKLVATGSHSDAAVKIWDAAAGTLLKVLPEATWRPAFSPDGKWLGTVGGGYRLWKVGTWEEGPKIGGGEGAAFSPDTDTDTDSTMLAVESGEGSIRLVDPNTGNEYARLEDPSQDRARHITFSPDGTQLIATNDDSRTIHVWDLRLIRRQLAERGLDWNLPPYPPPPIEDSQPLSIDVEATIADENSAASGITLELGKLMVRPSRQWAEKNKLQDEELKRFRAKAAEL